MKQNLGNKIIWLWQNAEKVLILAFLATFAFNIRKVFLTPYSYLNGEFNEYMTTSLSWADLLMFAVIIIYAIKTIISQLDDAAKSTSILEYIKLDLSNIRTSLASISRETFLVTIFLAWILLSVSWAAYKPIALYRFFTFLEIIAFFAILSAKFKEIIWLKKAIYAIIAGGIIQSALGIAQFAKNGSLGLRFLGESIVSQGLPGVAKIILFGEKHIRAYGTFPHPNILAGFLILPILILCWESAAGKLCSPAKQKNPEVPRGTILSSVSPSLLAVSLFVTLAGFILTFSRSAFLGLAMGLLLILFIKLRHCEALYKAYNIIWLKIGIFAISLLLTFSILLLARNTSLFSQQSLEERTFYANVSREIISSHPLTGIGIGQFVFQEYKTYNVLPGWQYQPVHNIYLLITSELGIVGVVILLLTILTYTSKYCVDKSKSSKLTYCLYCYIIIAFAIMAFFDHYFWDIKQGTIVAIIPFALLHLCNLSARSSADKQLPKQDAGQQFA